MGKKFKYYVEFYNGKNKRGIGQGNNYHELWQIMERFMVERNYTSHYQRLVVHDGIMHVDIGNWNQFFYIGRTDRTPITLEEFH